MRVTMITNIFPQSTSVNAVHVFSIEIKGTWVMTGASASAPLVVSWPMNREMITTVAMDAIRRTGGGLKKGEPGLSLDNTLLKQVVGYEQENRQEGHLIDGQRQGRHGGDGTVNAGQQPHQKGNRRHGRQAHHPHHRRQNKIQPVNPAGPSQQRGEQGDGYDNLQNPYKTVPPLCKPALQTGSKFVCVLHRLVAFFSSKQLFMLALSG